MNKLKIASKLRISFIIVNTIYVFCIIALIVCYVISSNRLHKFNDTLYLSGSQANVVRTAVQEEYAAALKALLLSPDEAEHASAIGALTDARDNTSSIINSLYSSFAGDTGKAAAQDLSTYYKNEYSEHIDRALATIDSGDTLSVLPLIQDLETGNREITLRIGALSTAFDADRDLVLIDSDAGITKVYVISSIVVSLVVTFVILIIRYLRLNIVVPIETVAVASETLATGSLDISISGEERGDEIGQLMRSFSQMCEGIRRQAATLSAVAQGDLTVQYSKRSDQDIIGGAIEQLLNSFGSLLAGVRGSAELVAGASQQISRGAQDLAEGSTEQAATVQQLSLSVSEIQNHAGTSSEIALQVLHDIQKAQDMINESSENMNQMTSSMQSISENSRDIAKVIQVIDSIAFQTNILALNASVEAARAGQHGKGFAVVADEVRNLAAKSASAARDTADLIERSVQSVDKGGEAAGNTSESLSKVVEIASSIFSGMDKLNNATQQQSLSISEINHDIDQLSSVIQRNSATAEENAASSQEMSAQAAVLNNEVDRFRIPEGLDPYRAIDTLTPPELSAHARY